MTRCTQPVPQDAWHRLMGDEDVQRLERQIDGLLGQYGALMQTQIRHDERIDEARADRAEIRAEIAKLEAELLAALGRSEQRTHEHIERVDRSCREFRGEYRRDRDKASERREQEREEARRQLEREREEARKQLAQELAKAQKDAQADKEWSRQKKLAVAGMLLAFATAVVASIITAAATIFGG